MEQTFEVMGWISVNDSLPCDNDEVLIYSTTLEAVVVRKLKPYACFYFGGKFISYGDKLSQQWLDSITVTHWMPKPPEK